MNNRLKLKIITCCAGFLLVTAHATTLDVIGVTLLRAVATNVNGAGISVGQVEAGYESPTNWQVNPGAVGQATNLFTYFSGTSPYVLVSSASTYPNSLGGPSLHARDVAGNFYGLSVGVATNVAQVDNYEANTFINYYINQNHAISGRVVNQSFTEGAYDTNVDLIYDNYAALHGVLFVTGAGFNGQPVYSPATCYNGIGVGVADNTISPNGPTPDGRSKPDIIAPGTPDSVTSYTTPQVSGAAAILMQAGTRGDGGSDTNSATDIRTVKALLLNGAIKPVDWTNAASTPLHPRYGAGVLNVFNSYKQLAGGKRGFNFSTNVPTDTVHPPVVTTNSITVLSGWDFNTNTSTVPNDGVNHYYFNVTNSMSNAMFTATVTLAWNRPYNLTPVAPKNLDLFLYNAANSNLVACSTSRLDNVEHIFLSKLAQGRYDLQVFKAGGVGNSGSEAYALAFEFFSVPLAVAKSGTNVAVDWPVYPAGFTLEAAASLAPPVLWLTNGLVAIVTNNQNRVVSGVTNANQFFRLRRP